MSDGQRDGGATTRTARALVAARREVQAQVRTTTRAWSRRSTE